MTLLSKWPTCAKWRSSCWVCSLEVEKTLTVSSRTWLALVKDKWTVADCYPLLCNTHVNHLTKSSGLDRCATASVMWRVDGDTRALLNSGSCSNMVLWTLWTASTICQELKCYRHRQTVHMLLNFDWYLTILNLDSKEVIGPGRFIFRRVPFLPFGIP
jgi:hypothetical protein